MTYGSFFLPTRVWKPVTWPIASQFCGQPGLPSFSALSTPISRTDDALASDASARTASAASAREIRLTACIQHQSRATVAEPKAAVHARARPLLVPVRDAPAVEVVGRQLDLDPVAREDADVVAPHLSRDVAEHLVVVVELHAEHRVGQGLHDLALHLDLLFLAQSGVKTTKERGPRTADRGNSRGSSGPGRWPSPGRARGSCRPRSGGPRWRTGRRRARRYARPRRARPRRGRPAPCAWWPRAREWGRRRAAAR